MNCDCMKRANEVLSQHNTRIEMLYTLGSRARPGEQWPISTVQIEKRSWETEGDGPRRFFLPALRNALRGESIMSGGNENVMIYVWPDGTWCYPDKVGEYTWKSDDYERKLIPVDSDPDTCL